MRRCVLFVLLLSTTFLFSCAKEGYKLKKVEQNNVLYTQQTKIYDYHEVKNKLDEGKNVYSLLEELNICQYKSINDINYTVIKCSNGYYMVLFDADGNYGSLQEVVFSPAEEKDFQALEIGMTLDAVKKIDPYNSYDFLLHSYSNYPQFSYHFFENGSCFLISYDNSFICDIVYFTI